MFENSENRFLTGRLAYEWLLAQQIQGITILGRTPPTKTANDVLITQEALYITYSHAVEDLEILLCPYLDQDYEQSYDKLKSDAKYRNAEELSALRRKQFKLLIKLMKRKHLLLEESEVEPL